MLESQKKLEKLIKGYSEAEQAKLRRFFKKALKTEVTQVLDNLYLPSIVSDKRVQANLLHEDFIKGANEQAYRLDEIKANHLQLFLFELG